MKAILCGFCVLFLLASCGQPAEVEVTALLETTRGQAIQLSVEIDKEENLITTIDKELKKNQEIVGRAQKILVEHQPGDAILIGGQSCSWKEVKDDLMEREKLCPQLETKLAVHRQTLASLRKSYDRAMKQIVSSQKQKTEDPLERERVARLEAARQLDASVADLAKVTSASITRTVP